MARPPPQLTTRIGYEGTLWMGIISGRNLHIRNRYVIIIPDIDSFDKCTQSKRYMPTPNRTPC